MIRFQYAAVRTALAGLMAIVGIGVMAPISCPAAEQTRDYLYSKFQNGDIPTQQDFKDMIDSYLNLIDDRFLLGRTALGSDGGAALYGEGSLVDGSLPYGDAAGLSSAWAGHTGFLALSFAIGPEIHFGYIQVSSGQPGSSVLYPMELQALVYEDQAGAPLVTTTVPEPSSLALAAFGFTGLAALGWRRRSSDLDKAKQPARLSLLAPEQRTA